MSSKSSRVKSLPMYSYMKVRRFSAGYEEFDEPSVVSMNTSEMKLCIFCSLDRPPEVDAFKTVGEGSDERVLATGI